jgi:predicted Ser/Thr protein kinase
VDDRLQAEQLSAEHHLPLADSRRFDQIAPELLALLPEATLTALRVVPLTLEDGFVIIACAEPEHLRYMKELSRYLQRPVRPVLAARRDIARTLRRHFGQVGFPEGWLPEGVRLDTEDDRGTLPPSRSIPALGHAAPAAGEAGRGEQHLPGAGAAPEPARAEPEEPPPPDATLPMTADEVRQALAEYAGRSTAAAPPAAAPPAALPASLPVRTPTPAPPAPRPGPVVLALGAAVANEHADAPTVALHVSREELQAPAAPSGARPEVAAPVAHAAAAPVAHAAAAPVAHAAAAPVPHSAAAPIAHAAAAPVAHAAAAPAPAMPAPLPLPPGVGGSAPSLAAGFVRGGFRERYRLVRKMATGGMAEVFLAKVIGAEGFERDVVVKKILPFYTEDPSFVEMFIDEAKITCRLNHPNIAQVYELANENDQYYMAMEYVEGKDLLTIMEHARRQGVRLPPTVSAYILASILEGLQHAHDKRDERGRPLGIIHRDVTPSNVLISGDGHVKVIDFGIAKAREKLNVTRVGYMKGKPGYLAPEQAKGEPMDRRVDLFAAGILLYELLTNTRLFSDSASASVMARLVSFDVKPLVRFNFRIPWSLRGVVRRALALHPEDRFATAADMAEPLKSFVRRKAKRDPQAELRSYLLRAFPSAGSWEGPTA